MKYLQLLFLLILILACSGTKRIVESTPQKTIEIEKELEVEDSFSEKKTKTNKEPNSTNHLKKIVENTIQQEILPAKPLYSSAWNNLLRNFVSENGNVNYNGFNKNWQTLKSYIDSLSENIPNESWSKNETMAYWINAYNAMTIDLILRHYPIKSIKNIKSPWEQRYWKLGDKWYNLDEIEHQILRKMNEPRIHFAIVCASYSCPKLQNEVFTAEDLEQQLTKATKEFLNDLERNSISENSIELSKIFKWFSKDFEQNGSLVNFLNQYSQIKISDNAKKSFKDYNWNLNE